MSAGERSTEHRVFCVKRLVRRIKIAYFRNCLYEINVLLITAGSTFRSDPSLAGVQGVQKTQRHGREVSESASSWRMNFFLFRSRKPEPVLISFWTVNRKGKWVPAAPKRKTRIYLSEASHRRGRSAGRPGSATCHLPSPPIIHSNYMKNTITNILCKSCHFTMAN